MSDSAFDAKAFVKTLTERPGVYRMSDANGTVIYVGKAKNLKRRVSSYFRASPSSAKVRALARHTAAVDVTVTHTETEALLLESNLIKKFQPRYNVLLRDDKGYPYIHIAEHPYPRLGMHRGARRRGGRYFGPYPNVSAVRETLQLMQKVFRLRQCDDSFFSNRSRACLQYQIQRCSGPCVGLIDAAAYAADVEHAARFLDGRSADVIDDLVAAMERSAEQLAYERAAVYRDQIAQLRKIQQRQYVSGRRGNLDVIAAAAKAGSACVQVFVYRDGRLLGNNAYFPKVPPDETAATVLAAFLVQYYPGKSVPDELICYPAVPDAALIGDALGAPDGRRVAVRHRVRGERARWQQMATQNAEHALAARLSSKAGMRRRFAALADGLRLDAPPRRVECFDISHTGGEATVASCVVFNEEGALKSEYRRYNINDVTPGDDYAAMRRALTRRYQKLRDDAARMPELVLIDGGKGQLRQAREVADELALVGVTLVGVAKGPERRAGMELLYVGDRAEPVILPADSAGLHLIQQIRDEAHRFAIAGHRQRRAKTRRGSALDEVPGVGPKRRQRLLKQFGGLRELARAGVEDIARVDGVSGELAQRIYDAFHHD